MQLFQKNIFSVSEPVFTKLSVHNQLQLTSTIELFYPGLVIKEIYTVGAFEINSNNWKIETDKGSYIFKRSDPGKLKTLTAQAAFTSILRNNSFPTLDFVKNKSDQLISCDDQFVYCLTHFTNGKYFGTSASEWKSLVCKLKSLSDLCINENKPREIPSRIFFTEEENHLVKKLSTYPDLPAVSHKQLSDVIEEYQALYSFFKGSSNLSTTGIFHVDIHPHNLIFEDDTLLLLTDFESFQYTNVEVSLGFGLYKCMRQLLAVEEESRRELLIRRLNSEFEAQFKDVTLNDLLYYAKADVLKRILYILRELLEQNDSKWLFVLETQLMSLEEIDEIRKKLKQ